MKPVLIALSFVGMVVEPQIAETENFVRYAMTQGGLFALVCVLGWSYRRDLMRLSDTKGERIAVLTEMVAQATAAQTKTADALTASAAALTTQANSIHGLTAIVTRLEGVLTDRRKP